MRGLLLTGREFLFFSDSEHENGNKGNLMVPPGCCGYLKEEELQGQRGSGRWVWSRKLGRKDGSISSECVWDLDGWVWRGGGAELGQSDGGGRIGNAWLGI